MKMRIALLACVLAVSAACGTNETETPEVTTGAASLSLGTVPDSVAGNVVTLPVDVSGISIVKPDGDTSGKSGHFHVFVDRDPVGVGTAIPKERGVVHSADNPVKVFGLKPGKHRFTIVVGDGTHKRIDASLQDSVTVDVKGPSVQGTTPATTTAGSPITVQLSSEGVAINKPDGSSSKTSGHYHVLVDPATPPKGGDAIPPAKEGSIYHTADASLEISGLAKGEHTLWVVLGDGNHVAFDPPVMDKLTVTVS